MAKAPSRDTIRCLAVATSIGGIIMANNINNQPDILVLKRQIDKAMKVFSHKQPYIYQAISNDINAIWTKLSKTHDTLIDEDRVPFFIEYFCYLIPENHFRTFLGISPYKSGLTVSKEVEALIMFSPLGFNDELNEKFGTKSYTIPLKRKKIAKVKKVRTKSKKVTKHEKEVQRIKAEKESKRQRLREMIAKAKERV